MNTINYIRVTIFSNLAKRSPFIALILLLVFSGTTHALDVTLTWSPPSNETVDGYIACYGFQSGSYTENCQPAVTTTEVTFSNISLNTDYYFAVKSVTEAGESVFSEEIKYNSSQDDPQSPGAFQIIASATTGGAISPSGNVPVFQGSERSFTVSPDAGYGLSDIIVDGISVGALSAYTFSQVEENHSIQAVFKLVSPPDPVPIKYTISATCGANGTMNPAGKTDVEKDGNLTVTITPAENYVTEKLLVDGVSIKIAPNYTFSKVRQDHAISASFVKKGKARLSPPIHFRVAK